MLVKMTKKLLLYQSQTLDGTNVQDISDINPHTLKEIEHFFATYKDLQNKKVEVKGFSGKEEAKKAFDKAIEMYKAGK
jgi:inorganic pyrophosphatase